MSEGSKVVKLFPKGVIDVAEKFVGVMPNEPNPKHQIASLRKQVSSLTAQLTNRRGQPITPLESRGALFTVLAGATVVAVGLGGLAARRLIARRN